VIEPIKNVLREMQFTSEKNGNNIGVVDQLVTGGPHYVSISATI